MTAPSTNFLPGPPLDKVSAALAQAASALTAHKELIDRAEGLKQVGLGAEATAAAEKGTALLLRLAPALPVLGEFARGERLWREAAVWLERKLVPLSPPIRPEERLPARDILAAMHEDGLGEITAEFLVAIFEASGHYVTEYTHGQTVPFRWSTPTDGGAA